MNATRLPRSGLSESLSRIYDDKLGERTVPDGDASSVIQGPDESGAGVASATVNAVQQVGGSVGTALLSSVAATASLQGASAGIAAIHGYATAFAVAAAIFLGAAIIAGALIPAGRPANPPGAEMDSEYSSNEKIR